MMIERQRRMRLKLTVLFVAVGASAGWVSRPVARSSYNHAPLLLTSRVFLSNPESRRDSSLSSTTSSSVEMSFNELHTLLRDAVAKEDFMEAGRISNIFMERLYGHDSTTTADAETLRARRRRMSWRAGAVPWLADRLDNLNYTFPTTIQINAMEAVQAILNTTTEESSLSELVDTSGKDMGVVISGATGSGKTLSYLVPMLSALSDSLFQRQGIRVGAEEKVGDATGNLLDRIALVTSPVVRSSSRRQTRQKGAIATGASIATLGVSSSNVTSPLSLIVVPTRELGVQTAMLLYQLVGGNIKDSPTQSSGKANFFKFKGPKGVRIGCVLDDEEAEFGLKLQTDVAITTPQYLDRLLEDKEIIPSKLRTIIFDEADLGLEQTSNAALTKLFEDDNDREYSRVTFLVGASVTKALGNMAVSNRLIPEGRSYMATSTSFVPLVADALEDVRFDEEATKAASLTDLDVCLQPGLKHERAVYEGVNSLLALTRLIRKELHTYDNAVASGATAQRPRVVIFFPDEDSAKTAIEPLRDALWGDHWLCVLLPKTGVRPLTIMDQFKRNQTSVMLATANSVRGLDFPALTHVYTMYLPVDDPREYVHLAGRVGRVGQQGAMVGDGAHVVSVLSEDEAGKMDDLAKALGFTFSDIEVPIEVIERTEDGSIDMENADVDKLRRYLEDAMTFSEGMDEDPTIDVQAVDVSVEDFIDVTDDADEDDDDDDMEEEPLQ